MCIFWGASFTGWNRSSHLFSPKLLNRFLQGLCLCLCVCARRAWGGQDEHRWEFAGFEVPTNWRTGQLYTPLCEHAEATRQKRWVALNLPLLVSRCWFEVKSRLLESFIYSGSFTIKSRNLTDRILLDCNRSGVVLHGKNFLAYKIHCNKSKILFVIFSLSSFGCDISWCCGSFVGISLQMLVNNFPFAAQILAACEARIVLQAWL